MSELIKHEGGYLKSEDFVSNGTHREFTFTVKGFHKPYTVVNAEGEVVKGHVLMFEEMDKWFVCNATNFTRLVYTFGERDPSKWTGKKVTLYVARGKWDRGKECFGIRVRAKAKYAPNEKNQRAGEDMTGKPLCES